VISTEGRDAQIEGNSLQELVVDKNILPGNSRALNGVFRRVSLLNNTLEVDKSFNAWLGANVISSGNHFIVSDDNVTVGTAVDRHLFAWERRKRSPCLLAVCHCSEDKLLPGKRKSHYAQATVRSAFEIQS
jgi:hypothetical protein